MTKFEKNDMINTINDKDAVICPNLCFDGMMKIYVYERALYDLVKCPYCKGKGKVSQSEANRIDALL